MSEPVCGDDTCEGCPTVEQIDALIGQTRWEGLRAANIILGLPEDYGLREPEAPRGPYDWEGEL